MRRARLLAALALGAAALEVGGCATDEASRYLPSLSSVAVPVGADDAAVTALVSIAGELPARSELPSRIELRVRLDNHGAEAATLEPDGLEVLTTDLRSLGRPALAPLAPIAIAPGGEATVSATFAVPPGTKLDAESMRALSVRLELWAAGRRYVASTTFDRVEQARRYPPYDVGDWPSMGFDSSPVIVIRRHGHPA